MPGPRLIAIFAFETPEHIIAVRQIHCKCMGWSPIILQIARDPGAALLASAESAEQFSPERGACVFSAQIGTYIDKPGSKDRAHGVGIVHVPQGMSTEEYKQKLSALLDRFSALPATQKCVLKCTVWSKYDSLESQIQSVGFPAPENDTFVVRLEYENQDRLMELASDSGIHTIIEAAMKDLDLSQGSYFCADVSTVFERN
ncbi:hypothetical protein B0H11DRAFT_2090329 [Mycena galericulata]|nr:hypothetical protein B0H11DRAFT_2090329 [Mycena galericulata]